MTQSQQEVVDVLVAAAKDMSFFDDVVRRTCDHHDTLDAQARCRETCTKATQALLVEFPELAKSLVVPTIETMLDDVPVTTGQTKFGGLPDIGPDFDWPASRTLTLEDAMLNYRAALPSAPVAIDTKPPMTFVAQLDLAALSKLDADFPDTGRLLFFMDWGAWFSADRMSKATVFWDQTPAATLTPAKPPKTLAWMDDIATGTPGAFDDMTLAINPFVSPQMPVSLTQGWTHIRTDALEYEDTAYTKRVADLGAADIYCDGFLYDVLDDFDYDEEPDTYPPRHQISGVPMPELHDPRYNAVVLSALGQLSDPSEDRVEFEAKIGLTGEALEAHEKAEGLKYKLLLQLDVASFLQIDCEEQFYFLLHEDELKARNFDKVVVFYEKT